MQPLDHEICYRAIEARDPRFDGVFFVGVTSTGIYCRSICRARKPRRVNCRFFRNAALAERAGLRPCKVCRPEQSPGVSSHELGSGLVAACVHQIEQGVLSDGSSLEHLSVALGVSARHLRREFRNRIGVSPIQFAQTHRLLMAKRLLAESSLSIVDVAMASGFRSLRRCHALFKSVYGLSPDDFRRTRSAAPTSSGSISLTLGYRPPYAWPELLKYFQGRCIPGVESITDRSYARTIQVDDRCGWIRVTQESQRNALRVEVSSELIGGLPSVLAKVRRAFDLDANPMAIHDSLAHDPRLAGSLRISPGLRLPGSMDSFETAIRTIVGQQVSVVAATTVMHRIVRAFGESVSTPWPDLNLKTITPDRLASASIDQLAPLGLNSARAKAILAISRAIVDGRVQLNHSADPKQTMHSLQELDGIGPWTASYFGMRILGSPDAFVASDLVVRKQLAPMTIRQIEAHSQAWRPWRAYAVMHLWNACGFFRTSSQSKSASA